MTAQTQKLSVSEIQSAYQTALREKAPFPLYLKIYEEVASTNSEAFQAAKNGAPEGTLFLAESQSAGRGRLKRTWESPPYKNLYLSVILRPPLPIASASQLTLVAGLACYEALQPFFQEDVTLPLTPSPRGRGPGGGGKLKLKWPNDLWVHSKKIGGILSEMDTTAEKLNFVVIGIGLNINAQEKDFSKNLQKVATSLLMETHQTHSRSQIAGLVLYSFFKNYELYLQEGFENSRKKWEDCSQMKGQKVKVQETNRSFEGICEGLDPSGSLLVKAGNHVEQVLAGDVIWR